MILRLAFLIALCFGINAPLKADHAMTLDLEYQCIDPVARIYKIRAIALFDCAGSGAQTFIQVNILPENFDTLCPLQIIKLYPVDSIFNVLPFCNNLPQDCSNPASPAVNQYFYEGLVTLEACRDNYEIFAYICCRSENFTNIFDSQYSLLTYKSTLHHYQEFCNNSPRFNSLPFAKFCSGKPATYNLNAFDIDGDSLVFNLITPHTANSYPVVQYRNGLTFDHPVGTTPNTTFDFNNHTGEFNFHPILGIIQNAVVAIEIKEYRNGVLIGQYSRDIIFTILVGCDNELPTLSSLQFDGQAHNSEYIIACQDVNLNLTFQDADTAQILRYESNILAFFPNAQINISGANPLNINVFIPYANLSNNYQTIDFYIYDNACPVNALKVKQLKIRKEVILSSPTPTVYLCDTGSVAIQMDDLNQNHYTYIWDNSDNTLSCTHCNHSIAQVQNNKIYTGIIQGEVCQKTISVAVNLVPLNLNLSGNTVNTDLRFWWDDSPEVNIYNGWLNLQDTFQTSDNFYTIANLEQDTCVSLILQAQNIHGCQDTDSLTLCSPACFRPINPNLTAFICHIGQDAIELPLAFNTYLWSNGATTASIYPNGMVNQYSVTVTSTPNCTHVYNYQIQYHSAVRLDIEITNTSYWGAEDGKITIQAISPFSQNYLYSLNNGTFSTNTEFENLAAGDYELIVVDSHFCPTIYYLQVGENTPNEVQLPTAFSPNGDGENDYFAPLHLLFEEIISFKIYNRWGEMVHNAPKAWDGNYKDTAQNTGIYIYILEYQRAGDNGVQALRGEILLMR